MEQQSSIDRPAIGRGSNAVHVLPADWSTVPAPLSAALDRVDPELGATQLLVVVANPGAAVALAQAAIAARGGTGPRIIAATGAARVARLLRAGSAPVVVGAPDQLLALRGMSVLKLDDVRTLVLAWVDDILSEHGENLEALLADVPKAAARLVISGKLDASVEDFIERHARRAPVVHAAAGTGGGGVAADETQGARAAPALPPVAFIATPASGRASALRRALDELDPPSAAIYVRSDAGEREARDVLQALGYDAADTSVVQIARDTSPSQHRWLVVLYDLPLTASEWATATGGAPTRVLALLPPRLLGHLRSLAGTAPTPLPVTTPLDAARAREAQLRADLRRELAAGTPARELLALEPLLTEFDGTALAAAALRLLEHERRARARLEVEPSPPLPDRAPHPHPHPRPETPRSGPRGKPRESPRDTRRQPNRPPPNARPLPRHPR